MKKVILEPKQEEVHYLKITDQSFIGYMTNETCKFMAVKHAGIILPIGRTNFLENNKSMFICMQEVVKNQYKAYEFESFDELIKWMSE